MSEAEKIVRSAGISDDGDVAFDALVRGITSALDRARTEAAAEAYARCRQLAASVRLSIAVDDEGKGWQRGVEAVVRKISNASPDPDFASRIRGEVLEEAIRVAGEHFGCLSDEGHRGYSCIAVMQTEFRALKEPAK